MSDSESPWEETSDVDEAVFPCVYRQESVLILDRSQIEERLATRIAEYSELLGISYEESLILLVHYNWKSHKLQDQWLDNELKVRVESGLSVCPADFDFASSRGHKVVAVPLFTGASSSCQICYEDELHMDSLQCQHSYCGECWRKYISHLMREKTIVGAKCPTPNCLLKLPETMCLKYLSLEEQSVYSTTKLEHFIYHSPSLRWCPSPNCVYVSEHNSLGSHEVRCQCGFFFCFACGEEVHRPASCQVVKDWLVKNSAESENITWMIANTKQCPTCRKPIEKNQGCNHMTCRKEAGGCNHEFCWLCMGPWEEHGSTTGGYYKCNKYEEQMHQSNSKVNSEEQKRENAKTELDKYMWYFERFNNHDKAQRLALNKQLPGICEKMKLLHDLKHYPIGELEFLTEAVKQVVDCRRVLKWTYAFGYRLDSGPDKSLFEHQQEKLEENTEHLHELIEQPLDPYFASDADDKAPFYCYKGNLINYFQVTKNFLENLLSGIENNISMI